MKKLSRQAFAMSTLKCFFRSEGKCYPYQFLYQNFGRKYGPKNARFWKVQEGAPLKKAYLLLVVKMEVGDRREGREALIYIFGAIFPIIILASKLASLAFSLRPEETLLVLTSQKLVWIISSLIQFYFASWINDIIIQQNEKSTLNITTKL